jgi:hypothetical protein
MISYEVFFHITFIVLRWNNDYKKFSAGAV